MAITDAQGNVFDNWQDLADYWRSQYVAPTDEPLPPPPSAPADEPDTSEQRAQQIVTDYFNRFLQGAYRSLQEGRNAAEWALATEGLQEFASKVEDTFSLATDAMAAKARALYDQANPVGDVGTGGGVLAAPPRDPGPGTAQVQAGDQWTTQQVANAAAAAAAAAEAEAARQAARTVLESVGGNNVATDPLEEGPFTRWLRSRGIGTGARTPGQRFIAGQYAPLRNLYETSQLISGAQDLPGMEFDPWAAGIPDVASRRARAASVLSSLGGMTGEQREFGGLTFAPTYDEFGGGEFTEGAGLRRLQDLMTGGLAPRLGARGAAWAASRVPFMQQQWELGGRGTPWIDYLRSKFSF